MKQQDFIRTYPGGSPVAAGTTVTIQKHIDNSVVASPTTDGNGMFTYSQDGSPGPLYYTTTVSGQTKKHSGKTTGQAGTWFLADHPYYFLAFSDGVYQGINNAMAVSAPGGAMTVQVATGQCLAYGHLYVCTAATTLTIASNSSGSTRVDLVVVQLVPPGNTEEGKILLAIHQGTPGAGAPAVTQTSSLWEVALAQVTVANGASAISAGNLTDVRTYTSSRIPNGFVTNAMLASPIQSPLTTLGDTLYGGVAGAYTRLAGNTAASKQFLTSTGTGTAAQAPAWAALASGDVTGALGYTPVNKAGDTMTGSLTVDNGATPMFDALTNYNVVEVGNGAVFKLWSGAPGASTLQGTWDASTGNFTAINGNFKVGNPSTGQVLTWNGTTFAPATPASGFADPETTAGDMIYRNGSNATTRLPVGSANQVLMATGNPLLPGWQTLVYSSYPVVSGQVTRDSIANGTAPLSSTTGTTLFSANVTLLNSVVYDIWVWGWLSCVAGSVWVKAAASWNGNDGPYLGHSDTTSAHMLGFAMYLGTVTGTGSATAFGVKGKVDAASPVATIYSGEVNFMAISRT